jgi:tetraacyldisaccharide 4'-kinase
LLLLPLSWLYRALAAAHRRWTGRARPLGVPVIVIGNLVAGGAGKTPSVLATVALLRAAGWRPGIVSRGYGRATEGARLVDDASSAQDVGDEPLLLHRRARVPVAVGRDRVAAAQALRLAHPGVNLIVSDDGLQHHRLPRDVQVIVFDERGAGNGHLLPAGPLREPLPAHVPPRSLLLYNAEAPSTALPGFTARRSLAGAVPLAQWWQGEPASLQALEALRGRSFVAAAGMAAPQRFFAMLQAAGLHIVPCPLPDHHDYAALPWGPDTSDVVVTEKDAVKLRPDRMGATRVWVVALDFAPEPAYARTLLALLPAPPHPE